MARGRSRVAQTNSQLSTMYIFDKHRMRMSFRTAFISKNRHHTDIPKAEVRILIMRDPTTTSDNDISTGRKTARIG
jgi:hypothetical protein